MNVVVSYRVLQLIRQLDRERGLPVGNFLLDEETTQSLTPVSFLFHTLTH